MSTVRDLRLVRALSFPPSPRHSRRLSVIPAAFSSFPPPSRHSRRLSVIPAVSPSFPRKRESTNRPLRANKGRFGSLGARAFRRRSRAGRGALSP